MVILTGKAVAKAIAGLCMLIGVAGFAMAVITVASVTPLLLLFSIPILLVCYCLIQIGWKAWRLRNPLDIWSAVALLLFATCLVALDVLWHYVSNAASRIIPIPGEAVKVFAELAVFFLALPIYIWICRRLISRIDWPVLPGTIVLSYPSRSMIGCQAFLLLAMLSQLVSIYRSLHQELFLLLLIVPVAFYLLMTIPHRQFEKMLLVNSGYDMD